MAQFTGSRSRGRGYLRPIFQIHCTPPSPLRRNGTRPGPSSSPHGTAGIEGEAATREAVEAVLDALDRGVLRCAEPGEEIGS